MKTRGFTLMIVVAIVCIIAVVFIPAVTGTSSNVSWGVNGVTESRCIEGYKFVLDRNGGTRQILDEFGKGVRCGM